jgi:DNA replication protein DnaC
VITSQLPRDRWHEYLGDPTLADAILDRVLHAAYPLRSAVRRVESRTQTGRRRRTARPTHKRRETMR